MRRYLAVSALSLALASTASAAPQAPLTHRQGMAMASRARTGGWGIPQSVMRRELSMSGWIKTRRFHSMDTQARMDAPGVVAPTLDVVSRSPVKTPQLVAVPPLGGTSERSYNHVLATVYQRTVDPEFVKLLRGPKPYIMKFGNLVGRGVDLWAVSVDAQGGIKAQIVGNEAR